MADMTLFRLGKAFEAFNATIDTAGGVSRVLDNQLKAKAESDLFYMQANLEKESNDFLNSLSQRNDYTKWEKDIDAFMDRQYKVMQDGSANAYTARAADRIALSYRNNLQQRAAVMSVQKQRDDILSTDASTVNMIQQNNSGQTAIDKTANIFDMEYANGLIDASNYKEKIISSTVNQYNNHFLDMGYTLIDNAINEGKSFDAVADAIMRDETTYTSRILDDTSANREVLEKGEAKYIDISSSVNRDAIKQNALSVLKDHYNGKVTQLQKDNANRLSQYWGQVWDNGNSLNDRIDMCIRAIDLINNNLTGYQLSEQDRNEYIRKFTSLRDELQKGLGTVISSGGGTRALESFASQTELKESPDTWLQKVKDGTLDFYQARDSLQNELRNLFYSQDWKETLGMTQEQKEEFFQKNYSEFASINILNSKTIMDILQNEPKFASLYSIYQRTVKDIEKNPDNYDPQAASYLAGFIMDLVASSKWGDSTEDLVKKLNTQINAVTLSKMKSLYRNKGIFGYKDFGDDNKGIAEGALSLKNNDYVYTDIYGEERWAPQAKERAENIAGQQRIAIAAELGIDEARLQQRWTQTANDMTAEPVFSYNGKEYRIEPVVENGKAEDYRILEDGKVMFDSSIDKRAMTQDQRLEAEKKQARENTDEFKRQRNEETIKHWESVETIPAEAKAAGYSQTNWEMMSGGERRNLMEAIEENGNR